MKRCTKCGETKPFTEFYKHKNNIDGHTYHCKVCDAERRKQWYQKAGKEVDAERHRRYLEEIIAEQPGCVLSNCKLRESKSVCWRNDERRTSMD